MYISCKGEKSFTVKRDFNLRKVTLFWLIVLKDVCCSNVLYQGKNNYLLYSVLVGKGIAALSKEQLQQI